MDMVFTDPPYGMGKDFDNDSGDMRAFHEKWIPVIKDLASGFVIWYSPRQVSDLLIPAEKSLGKMKLWLHLYKPNDITFPYKSWIGKSECAVVFGNPNYEEVKPYAHDTYLWNHTGKDKSFYHPSVKPFEVISDMIPRFGRGIFLDPFLGSGTTLIACEQLDRICYGMEISPQYCEIICQRWEKLTGQKRQKVTA